MIITRLSQFIAVNDPGNNDGLKNHSTSPKEQPIGVHRVTYHWRCTGDCEKSVASKLFASSSYSLDAYEFFLVPAKMRKARFNRASDRQYRSWVGNYSHLLVIRYEEIWDRKEEIAQHFGIDDPMFLVNFPPKEKRKST